MKQHFELSLYAVPAVLASQSRQDLHQIELVVCSYYNLPQAMLRRRSRQLGIIHARRSVFLLAYDAGYGPTSLGRHYGLSHATVCHAIKKLRDEMSVMPHLKYQMTELRQLLAGEIQQQTSNNTRL